MTWRRTLLRPAARIAERLPRGGKLPQLYWRYRHLIDGSAWIEGYFGSRQHEHRVCLAEVVVETPGASSCLEVGANAGANLATIHRLRPDWRLLGVEINPRAVRVGRRLLADAGMDVDLRVGDCCRLSSIADKEVDVVLSDAVLMYVSPDCIRGALSELVRVSSRRVVLNEFTVEGASRFLGRDWAHDLKGILTDLGLEPRVESSPRAPVGGEWATLGKLIIAER